MSNLFKEGALSPLKPKLVIGIDTGVNTGIAAWDVANREFKFVKSTTILKAQAQVRQLAFSHEIFLMIEDARQVKFKTSAVKAQGAGSVKRDASIWEEFCEIEGFECRFVRPNKKITKLNQTQFRMITGYAQRTNGHGRDAGMICFQQKF